MSSIARLAATLASLAATSTLQQMDGAAKIPAGQFFCVERTDGKCRFGDSMSGFAGSSDMNDLTFDVSNLRALGNMGVAAEFAVPAGASVAVLLKN